MAAGWIVLVVVVGLLASRSMIGGFDFYSNLCNARDLTLGRSTQGVYGYFPGIYSVWRAVVRLGGETLAPFQWAYIGVLTAVLVLVASIVLRATQSWLMAILAAVWTMAFASHCDGFEGCAEPLATVPVLIGLVAWGGEPLRGRRGYLRAMALGAGLGFALYVKQQAGLLALGAAALLPDLLLGREQGERRHSWLGVALVPATAIVAFLLGILTEGHGLDPIRIGLSVAKSYGAQASFGWNIENAGDGTLTVKFVLVSAVVTLVAWIPQGLISQKDSSEANRAANAVWGFAAAAALAALYQLTRRHYGHYLLLSGPFAVIAAFVFVDRKIRTAKNPDRARTVALVMAFALLLVGREPWGLRFYAPGAVTPPPGAIRWLSFPNVAADVEQAKALVKPGTPALVLPTVRNELHFHLGTRSVSPEGYGWSMPLEEILRKTNWDEVEVVLFVPSEQANAYGFWGPNGIKLAAAELERRNFVIEKSFPSFHVIRHKK